MSRKLIQIVGLPDAGKTCRNVKIYKDSETGEYVCELHISGAHYEPADYFTDDKTDAIGTAKHMCLDPNRIKSQARDFLELHPRTHYSNTDRMELLDVRAERGANNHDYGNTLFHWRFADGSFLYFNKSVDGWTV